MQGQFHQNNGRIGRNLADPPRQTRRIVRGDARAVAKKGTFFDSFAFAEDCFIRVEDHICWQTQLEDEQLEHFDVFPQVDLCVRPTHIIAEHALAIFTIRHQRVIYFLVVELIPTGEKGPNAETNVVLNYVVLKNYPENIKFLNYYTVKPRTKVHDLLAFGADFVINRGGVYSLMSHNCFHYIEHVLKFCCEDYDNKALKGLDSFKQRGKNIVITTATAIIAMAVAFLIAKGGIVNVPQLLSRFKFTR
jgi:hypothetical protein